MPEHVTRDGFTYSPRMLAAGLYVYKLSEFKIGTVAKTDVATEAVEFPSGVRVQDEVNPLPGN